MARKNIPEDTYYFQFYDANPKGRVTGDCVIRAIAAGTGKTWETVLKDLTEIALKYKVSPLDSACYQRYLEQLGFTKMSQPRKQNGRKYTAQEFCEVVTEKHKDDDTALPVIIAHVGGNHLSLIRGHTDFFRVVVTDTWDCSNGCVGNYWIKKQ